jgi:hypothetical protein
MKLCIDQGRCCKGGEPGARAVAKVGVLGRPLPSSLTRQVARQRPGLTSTVHREFCPPGAKFDQLLHEMRRSNEIAGEPRDQLVAEMRAGRALLEAPRPDPKSIEILLIRPLEWKGEKGGRAILGALAVEALHLLQQLMAHAPSIPN